MGLLTAKILLKLPVYNSSESDLSAMFQAAAGTGGTVSPSANSGYAQPSASTGGAQVSNATSAQIKPAPGGSGLRPAKPLQFQKMSDTLQQDGAVYNAPVPVREPVRSSSIRNTLNYYQTGREPCHNCADSYDTDPVYYEPWYQRFNTTDNPSPNVRKATQGYQPKVFK